MQLTPESLAAHADLSPHNLAFVEAALADPVYRRRASFAEFDRRTALRHYPLQCWPTLIGAEALAGVTRTALGIHRVCRAVPERVFGGDLGRIAEFYGLDPAFAERTLGDPAGIERAPSRGDYIWSSTGLKCVEFNCGNSLGGWQMPLVADLYLDHPLIAGFLDRRGLSARHRDSMQMILEHMVGEAVATGVAADGEANVAFILYPTDPDYAREVAPYQADIEASFRPEAAYRAAMERALESFPQLERGEVLFCSYGDLEVRDGGAWLGDRRVHAIGEILGFPTPQVFGCYRGGGVQLFSGPISMILGDKRNLALLSRAAESDDGAWSAEERGILRDHLPWTRLVGRGRERYRGEEAALPELLAGERERLVLKRSQSFGGSAVHVGRATPAAAWEQIAEKALADGDWIVQEHVDSRPFLYQSGDEGCVPHLVIWGLFVYGERYAGALIRLQPTSGDAVVNIHRGASTSVLLEID